MPRRTLPVEKLQRLVKGLSEALLAHRRGAAGAVNPAHGFARITFSGSDLGGSGKDFGLTLDADVPIELPVEAGVDASIKTQLTVERGITVVVELRV